MPGFGTVVTGTLQGASLAVGQDVRVYPGEQVTKIRGLQIARAEADRGVAGQPDRGQPGLPGGRGRSAWRRACAAGRPRPFAAPRCPFAPPGGRAADPRTECRGRFLHRSLRSLGPVDVARPRAAQPGDDGWVQVRLRQPLALVTGDRFIVRRPSPSVTIGGGEVIDPAPARHRRFRPDVLAALDTLSAGDPAEIVLQRIVRAARGQIAPRWTVWWTERCRGPGHADTIARNR